MEIKINPEIREYNETVFFGLSWRQFFFAVLSVISAVGIWFFGGEGLSVEIRSWLCILAALPGALLGFFRYHGMPPERLLLAMLKTYLMPKHLIYGGTKGKGEKENCSR